MPAVLVQICVDPRLDHGLVRAQVRQKLRRRGGEADLVYLLNEPGGNLGQNFRATLQMLVAAGEPLVLCAVLHHDDCLAAARELRADLDETAQAMAAMVKAAGRACPVLTGKVLTVTNHVLWADEPAFEYRLYSFGVYG